MYPIRNVIPPSMPIFIPFIMGFPFAFRPMPMPVNVSVANAIMIDATAPNVTSMNPAKANNSGRLYKKHVKNGVSIFIDAVISVFFWADFVTIVPSKLFSIAFSSFWTSLSCSRLSAW